jgi:hypothetical protein
MARAAMAFLPHRTRHAIDENGTSWDNRSGPMILVREERANDFGQGTAEF